MARDKVVLWLQDDGTFEDQFGTEQDCTFVRQQVVATLVNTKTHEGGYGQRVRRYYYEDELGRRFLKVNDGVSYFQGRRYQALGDEEYEGTWKRAKKLDRDAPYVTPGGTEKVEILGKDHDPGYEFYEATQTSIL